MPTETEIMAARTIKGGWSKRQLAEWGVAWPPPAGWKEKLIAESRGGDLTIDDGRYCDRCREANALHCMAAGPCDRRDMAREIARPRCGCTSETVRRVLVEHGTCGKGGCPYGGDF